VPVPHGKISADTHVYLMHLLQVVDISKQLCLSILHLSGCTTYVCTQMHTVYRDIVLKCDGLTVLPN